MSTTVALAIALNLTFASWPALLAARMDPPLRRRTAVRPISGQIPLVIAFSNSTT